MEAQFKVPKIPLVSANSFGTGQKPAVSRKHSAKSSSVPKQQTTAAATSKPPPTNKDTLQNGDNKNHSKSDNTSSLPPASNSAARTKPVSSNKSRVESFLPKEGLPKLCPSCSQILVQYLSPIEAYIKEIIHLVDTRGSAANLATLITNNASASLESANVDQSKRQVIQRKVSQHGEQTHQHTAKASAAERNVSPPSNNHPATSTASYSYSHESTQPPNYTATTPETQTIPTESNNFHRAETGNNEHFASYESNPNQPIEKHVPNKSATSDYYHHQSQPQQSQQQQQIRSSDSGNVVNLNVQHQNQNWSPQDQAGPAAYNENSSAEFKENVNANVKVENATNETHQGPTHENVEQRDWPQASKETYVQSHHQESGVSKQLDEDTIQHEPYGMFQDQVPLSPIYQQSGSSPFAYVTIAYDNLSAVNAILLANSIQLYNNKVLNVLENNEFVSKKIINSYHIPTVILLCDSINGELKNIIYQVFDKVIESKYQDAILLNDESLGIQQYKIHLWKELAFQYEKCIFLESFTMVVGQISDLLPDSQELSACVDCFFPDNFNCSVFVFEPNMDTYRQLLNYGMQLKLSETSENPLEFETLDEMTLLNHYFANKWRKLSFIYNFVRNDMAYTQVPAYFKFGNNIRVVNFGNIAPHHSFYASQQVKQEKFGSSTQPWNYKFDLNKAQLEEDPFEAAPVDNYFKFYLRCFMRRVWPLLSQTITPILLSRYNGRTEWTIFELMQILGAQSGIGFSQNPVTMRRKKSWAVEPNLQLDTVEIEQQPDDDNVSLASTQTVEHANQTEEPDTNKDKVDQLSIKQEEEETKEYSAQPKTETKSQEQLDEENKRQWEDGRVDWMGQHQSDRIINRLKNLFQ